MEHFARRIWDERATAIVRAASQHTAARAMDAAVKGGFRVIEFTLTVPGALDLVTDFARRSELCVGVGTVLRVEDVHSAARAGARFVVSPVIDEDVVREASALGLASMPGVHTPTELLRAHRAGATVQKLFPAPAGGPSWLRSVLAPMPFLRIVPTNGVDGDNAAEWLRAGAWALGFVASLFSADDLRDERWNEIERRAARLLAIVGSVQRGAPPEAHDPFSS